MSISYSNVPPSSSDFTDRLLSKSEVLKIVGVSASTLYWWIHQGNFPPPVKLGPRRVAWRLSDVLAWMAKLKPTR